MDVKVWKIMQKGQYVKIQKPRPRTKVCLERVWIYNLYMYNSSSILNLCLSTQKSNFLGLVFSIIIAYNFRQYKFNVLELLYIVKTNDIKQSSYTCISRWNNG